MATRRRVLLAEGADAVRQVAEAVLRQSGFEVIAVVNAEKAREVLELSRPDLIVLDAGLAGDDRHPLFERIQSDPKTASIPLVLIEREDKADLPLPPEVVVSRPLDPLDLLQKVMTFSGQGDTSGGRSGPNPFGTGGLDDELLDAALGLDRIDVTASEVLERTTTHLKVPPTANSGHTPGFEQETRPHDEHSDSTRVESLMIRDESAEISKAAPPRKPDKPKMSGTSKLEIMSDQYGLHDPNAMQFERKDEVHDYDWFVKSMRDDGQSKGAGGKAPAKAPGPDSFDLNFTDPSTLVDPVTPAPATKGEKPAAPTGGSSRSTVGVEKFIDEFKKEIERIRSTEGENIMVEDAKPRAQSPGTQLSWEETLEKVNPAQVELFTRQLAAELASQLAERIAAKIDPDKLLQIIKNEIVGRLRERRS
ncbi:MAG: hypothetical protein AB1644_02800 [Candidatus Zixiibacteriota bacterium]